MCEHCTRIEEWVWIISDIKSYLRQLYHQGTNNKGILSLNNIVCIAM